MENRSAFFWYPRFVTTAIAVTGLLGISLLLPSRLADSYKQTALTRYTPTFSPPPQLRGKIVTQVQLGAQEKAIALTFDDGPWPDTTFQVLNILRQNNIKATFFWIGRNLKKYPDIGRQVVAEGHAIGNHTWHHWYFHMNPATAAAEIENTSKLIYQTTGVQTFLFRPPGGFMHNGLVAYARSKNYGIMMWNSEPGEFRPRNTVAGYVKNVVKMATPGGIVLLHDVHPKTVLALPQIIAGLRQRGYRFVTIPQLLEMQAQAPKSKPKVEQVSR
jgi:chitin deacetylase